MPASPTLMQPTSITGLVLSAGTVGGGGQGNPDFYIKTETATLDHRVPVSEITGDGDSSPRFLPSYYLYVDWIIRGWAVAGQAIGILNLINSSKNPTGTTLVQFNLAASRGLKGAFVIPRIKIEWADTAVYVGILMLLKSTNTTADGKINYTEAI